MLLLYSTIAVITAAYIALSPMPVEGLAMEKPLLGRVALVTGSSRGIGKGCAKELSEAGATTYVLARSKDALEITVAEISASGGRAIPLVCDVSDEKAIKDAIDTIEENEGALHILVNSAFTLGGTVGTDKFARGMHFWEQGSDVWDPIHSIGLRSYYLVSCLAAPLMIKSATKDKPGLIAHMSSFGGATYTFNVAYGVGKQAVDRLARDMGLELKDHDVSVVSMWPGIVRTETNMDLINSNMWEERTGMPNPEIMESPNLTGKVICKLAADPEVMKETSKIQIVAEAARAMGISDLDGSSPPSIRSLQFLIPSYMLPWTKGLPLIPDWRLPLWVMSSSSPPPPPSKS